MSRYILFPDGKSKYFLIPVEGFNQSVKEISLPHNLGVHNKLISKAKNIRAFKNLLIKLSKTRIQRTKDGIIRDNNKSVNVDYDKALLDSCNNRFSLKLEEFYCLLREHGITF